MLVAVRHRRRSHILTGAATFIDKARDPNHLICMGLPTTLPWRLSWRGYATTIPTSYRLALWMALSHGEYAMNVDCAPGFPSSEIATYTRRAVRLVPRRASLPGCASSWRRSTSCARWRSSYKLSLAHTARLPCCWPTSRRRISTPRRYCQIALVGPARPHKD